MRTYNCRDVSEYTIGHMSNTIRRYAMIAAVVFAVVAIATLVRGDYMIAGMSFLLLSFSLYVMETRGE